MEQLTTAVLAACAVSMLTGMLQLLRPNEKFDRQIRLLTAGLLAMSVLTPLLQGIRTLTPDWDLLTTEASDSTYDFTEAVREQTEKQIQENLERTLRAELQAQGVSVTALEVTIHISEEDSIDITNVTAESDTPAAVKRILRAYLGEEVELIVATNQTEATE